jgi:asparagine synthase (glutamine-hydrolysing)
VSVQFGACHVDGEPLDLRYLEKAKSLVSPYEHDGNRSYIGMDVAILWYPFHTTSESRGETQPYISASGGVYTWDGRLDNGTDLLSKLKDSLPKGASDVEIVAAAHARWGTDCFAKLIGDWALTIWEPRNRSLTLATDFIGTRHLYYIVQGHHITWSSVLDPLVLLDGRTFPLNEEYLAGYLSFLPAAQLTPYVGIHSVPPSSFVFLGEQQQTVRGYWEFDSNNRIRYDTDAEYEEHFRTIFRDSVRRRLRSDTPVLAELSGGMDSSSIVCMADTLLGAEARLAPRLDTVSYYSDSEPDWNERPYFTKVETQRGRPGCHIDLGHKGFFRLEVDTQHFVSTPASSRAPETSRQIAECMTSNGNRVVLSGIGGDEVMGGVPTPIPELADLLARAKVATLARELKLWALDKRRPWLHLLWQTCRGFLPLACAGEIQNRQPASWLGSDFVRRQRAALSGYTRRTRLFGSLPSFQENLSAFEALQRRLAWSTISAQFPCEKRYPYLDRSLLEFLYAIPREQLVRPGHRRSLMRRALRGIVPGELLTRRRKAFVDRAPRTAISDEWKNLVQETQEMICTSLRLIDRDHLLDAMDKARQGHKVQIVPLLRTLALEHWLRHVAHHGVFGPLSSANDLIEQKSLLSWETQKIGRR